MIHTLKLDPTMGDKNCVQGVRKRAERAISATFERFCFRRRNDRLEPPCYRAHDGALDVLSHGEHAETIGEGVSVVQVCQNRIFVVFRDSQKMRFLTPCEHYCECGPALVIGASAHTQDTVCARSPQPQLAKLRSGRTKE